jgi:hypothetical protein
MTYGKVERARIGREITVGFHVSGKALASAFSAVENEPIP